VQISRPYSLGKYPVTVGQFQQFVRDTGYRTEAETGENKGAVGLDPASGKFEHKAEFNWQHVAFPQTDRHPVVHVGWNDAIAFCHWLSSREGQHCRLPTEAEWEYACRAGTTKRFGDSDDEETVKRIANIADAALRKRLPTAETAAPWNDGYPFISPVGQFRPNAFGLYDMQGNVWEWCADWYGFDYYASSPVADPPGPDSGTHRVLRGGCWYTGVRSARCARRFGFQPEVRSDCMGFRVAVDG
jgi:formylglycine-generating enzyme required for sulfatase activity